MQVKEISFFMPVLSPFGWVMVWVSMGQPVAQPGWKILGVKKQNVEHPDQ
jgi:hypothetical protein